MNLAKMARCKRQKKIFSMTAVCSALLGCPSGGNHNGDHLIEVYDVCRVSFSCELFLETNVQMR